MGTVLQIAGIACVVAGAALIAPAAGFIVGGIACVLLGVAVETANRKDS
jgi:hypothetical protein